MLNEEKGNSEKIKQAAKLLREGKLVAFPTETVYGLGANALDDTAVKKIYEAKGRPSDNPLIVHLSDACEMEKYAIVTEAARKIIDRFMPAPLTVVLKKKEIISDVLTGGRNTVAIRVPKDKVARKLIEFAGVPIAAPSANLSGKPSPTSATHVISGLNGRVDAILCGNDCEIGLESTVVSFESNDICILRSGAITEKMLKEVVGDGSVVYSSHNLMHEKCGVPQSPGMKYAHYSPDAPLYILTGGDSQIIDFLRKEINEGYKKIGFLCHSGFEKKFKGCKNLEIIALGGKNNLDEQARNFFIALNSFNEAGVDVIYATEPSREGIGEALYNRLTKASGGNFIFLG